MDEKVIFLTSNPRSEWKLDVKYVIKEKTGEKSLFGICFGKLTDLLICNSEYFKQPVIVLLEHDGGKTKIAEYNDILQISKFDLIDDINKKILLHTTRRKE